jgi:hypothetical protein
MIRRDPLRTRRGAAPAQQHGPQRVALAPRRVTAPRVSAVATTLVLAWFLAACGGLATPTGVPPTTPLPATPTVAVSMSPASAVTALSPWPPH